MLNTPSKLNEFIHNSYALGAVAIVVAIAVFVLGGYFVFRNKKDPPIESSLSIVEEGKISGKVFKFKKHTKKVAPNKGLDTAVSQVVVCQ
jgi:hypothetical protein